MIAPGSRLAPAIAAAAAMATFVVGIVFGTFVAGGSDSSCYLSAAQLLARGTLHLDEPIANAPWRDATKTFAPAGHVASPRPGEIVPMCPLGLPILMAAFARAHLSPFLVVPLLGAMAVWLTYLVGCRVDRPLTGAAAAVLVACSPIVLYQVVQPMTDVPAAAWWLLVVLFAVGTGERTGRPLPAGLAASVALVTRPNLLALAVVVAAYILLSSRKGERIASGLLFGAGLLPAAILVALLHRSMYGSPLSTGYGPASGLFAITNVLPNLRRYPAWLVGAHTPLVLLAFVAPPLARRTAPAWLCLALVIATTIGYLPYVVFDDWWYIRFLLPAVPPLVLLTVVAATALAARVAPRREVAWTVTLVAVLMFGWIRTARARQAFDLAELEHHYYRAGTAAAERLPRDAVVITSRDTGSVHYYAGRPTVSWDLLAPSSLDGVVAFLRDRGRTPYLLLEADEEPEFRARFRGASRLGELDWPPAARIGRSIRIYDPHDRARFLADGQVRTDDRPDDPRRAARRAPRAWLDRR